MDRSVFWEKKDGTLVVGAGERIEDAIAEGIKIARERGEVVFDFNDVFVHVAADSNAELIYRDWSRALDGYIARAVGPYPKPVLSQDELRSDAQIEAGNKARREREARAYEEKERLKREALEARLSGQAPATMRDQEGWDDFVELNSKDGYSKGVVTYAERWARLMELELSSGKKLEEIAKSASHEADIEGITGFMYGCAVQSLAQFWQHGEALRRWHNLDSQIRDEGEKANESGGVLNPAVLNIGRSALGD